MVEVALPIDAERVREIFRRVLAGERSFGRLADEMRLAETARKNSVNSANSV